MRTIVHQGHYLTLSTEEVDGHLYERVSMRSGVRVIPIQDKKILFIKEYRKHEKRSRLKLISGWVDKDHVSTLDIAKEELREEVSMEAGEWSLFHTHHTSNGTIEEHVDYFIAKELHGLPKQVNPDNDIVEEQIWLDQEEFVDRVRVREILWDKDVVVVWMLIAQ